MWLIDLIFHSFLARLQMYFEASSPSVKVSSVESFPDSWNTIVTLSSSMCTSAVFTMINN